MSEGKQGSGETEAEVKQAIAKQFMVVKMVVGAIGAAISVIPLGGMMPFDLAEQLRERLAKDEPESVFFIQEVGMA